MGGKDSGRSGVIRVARSLMAVAALLLGGAVLTGCAGPAIPADRPPDFSLAVTIYRPNPVPIEAPIEQRDARFVLEADGVLRAEFGPKAREMGFPRIVRRLRPEQIDAVWNRVRDAELLGLSPEGRIPGPEVFVPTGRSEAVIETMADGRRRTVVRTLDREAESELLDDLGNFVWVRGLARN
ncbi:MAG: hypothetical protein AAF297_11135 [Planctomycetota bacterium]